MRQRNNTQQAKQPYMANYDPESARAWALIMQRVHELRRHGETLEQIGKRMDVGRDTVSRWVRDEGGGERTSFGAMIRYAKSLRVPYNDLILHAVGGKQADLQPLPTWTPSLFEEHLAATLMAGANLFGKKPTEISLQLFGTIEKSDTITAMLKGKEPISVEMFASLSKAIGLEASEVLKRVVDLVKSTEVKEPEQQTLAG